MFFDIFKRFLCFLKFFKRFLCFLKFLKCFSESTYDVHYILVTFLGSIVQTEKPTNLIFLHI
jgi:hypothetical protein